MRAKQAIEKLTGPSSELVDQIVTAIIYSFTVEEANDKLEPFDIQFKDCDDFLHNPGALGGYDGKSVLLNPRCFHIGGMEEWTTIIAHELVHREQLSRASAASGKSAEEIAARKTKSYMQPNGRVDTEKYMRDPMELQAYARNALDSAKSANKCIKPLLRSGGIARFSPNAPGDRKRFLKYAYQMANK